MSVIIRGSMSLQEGCRLYYDPPQQSGSFVWDEFFATHRGRFATFIAYSERLIGPLDLQGRKPGCYTDKGYIKVQFEGEKPCELKTSHFIVRDKIKATFSDECEVYQRIGELPHSILFYPDDWVCFVKKPDEEHVTDGPRLVRKVFTEKPYVLDSIPRYEVLETDAEMLERKFREKNKGSTERNSWNTAGENLELVKRGNVWALYEPSMLYFSSHEDELKFWGRTGVSYLASDPNIASQNPTASLNNFNGRTFEDAWMLFESGKADIIFDRKNVQQLSASSMHDVRKLHDCFSKHRDHVRALTQDKWAARVKTKTAV